MLSEMCKREYCHCLCLQETHRAPHLARPKIPGMTLIAERPHIKYGSAILIRSDWKVRGVSVWGQDNVELISIEMPRVVVYSVYKPTKREVCTSTRTRKPTSYCDRRLTATVPHGDTPTQTTMEKRLNSG